MSIIIWSAIFLVILVLVFIWIGVYYKKKAESSEGFLLAGRSAPFWLLSCAYLGGALGGSSVAGFAGTGFSAGMAGVWPAILPSIGCVAFILVFARRLNHFGRETGAVTITDFLCERYGESIRIPAAIISLFRPAFLTGMQYLAIAVALRVAFGWELWIGVVVSAVVILLYLITAGQYSALVTQWIQGAIQSIAIIVFTIMAIKLIGNTPEAIHSLYTMLPESFLSGLNITFSQFSVWFLTMGLFYLVDPWIYMWAYIGESPRISRNAQLATNASNFFMLMIFVAGMCVAAAVSQGIIAIPAEVTPDALYSYLAMNETTVLVGTFLIVGLIMTIVSCGSSFAMNGVTILTNDIYNKVLRKNATDAQKVRASKISLILVSAFGIVGALWLPILVPLWSLAQAIAISGLLAAVLSAWFWKRSTTTGAFLSIVLGGGVAIVFAIYAWLTTGNPGNLINGIHACHVGLLVSIIAMIVGSLVTKPNYEKVNSTSYKQLGIRVDEHEEATGNKAEPGIWGSLDAKTWVAKTAWILVLILFVLHVVFVVLFQYEVVGHITMWTSLVACIGMFLIFTILGAKDLKKFNGK